MLQSLRGAEWSKPRVARESIKKGTAKSSKQAAHWVIVPSCGRFTQNHIMDLYHIVGSFECKMNLREKVQPT
jgi:hypothetical protein